MRIRFDRDAWRNAQADFREDWRGLLINEQGVIALFVTLVIVLLKVSAAPLAWLNCWKLQMWGGQ